MWRAAAPLLGRVPGDPAARSAGLRGCGRGRAQRPRPVIITGPRARALCSALLRHFLLPTARALGVVTYVACIIYPISPMQMSQGACPRSHGQPASPTPGPPAQPCACLLPGPLRVPGAELGAPGPAAPERKDLSSANASCSFAFRTFFLKVEKPGNLGRLGAQANSKACKLAQPPPCRAPHQLPWATF